ncbi:cytochrome b-c1 complex subunit 1, mitochondrial-like [Zerene cesonia]|uniref:cytochrome b-c1 complex subunit 1, mitochondrial-like n=1 Tax=Zerene cesonia TaxID=33412 RepID=UPI0018E4E20E|nr:cytochrome b-c1 complex subunit 1, mitochondrial-like [Zerene cesonia]
MWKRVLKHSYFRKRSFKTSQIRKYNSSFSPQFEHFLNTQANMNCSHLTTGLVVANEERESFNSCVGIFINAGSRYELAQENGVAHFFQHICFKGTNKRPKNVLENEISGIGAKLKCFTNRELVGFYAECLNEQVPQVVDILTDCIFNNAYSSSDIEIQKCVVYQEMLKYDTDTYKVIMDYLHTGAFQGTSLSQSVMGPSYNLYNFSEQTIKSYVNKMFVPSKIILACAGGVKHDQLLGLANTYVNKYDAARCPSYSPYRFTDADIRYRDDSLEVGHIAMAFEAPPFQHEDRLALELASAVVGAWDRSQAGGSNHAGYLAQAAASGLANSFESFYTTYKDTGLWGIHFVSPRMHIDDMINCITHEWMNLCNCVTNAQLLKAKLAMKYKIILLNQKAEDTCKDIAKWVHFTGCVSTMQEKFRAIDNISAEEVRRACQAYIYNSCPVVGAYGAIEQLYLSSRLMAGTYWLKV